MILAQEAQGSGISTLVLFVFLGLMFYLMIIRPQRTRARKQQELVEALEIGGAVLTVGGMHGVIRSIDETSVVLEVENGTIRFSKRAIASKQDQE